MISILVAGTVELSGSKSPIVAMAKAFLFFLKKSLLLNTLTSHLYYSTKFPTGLSFLFHPPRQAKRESRAPGAGSSCSCCWLWLARSCALGGIPEDEAFIHGEKGERERATPERRSGSSGSFAPLFLLTHRQVEAETSSSSSARLGATCALLMGGD